MPVTIIIPARYASSRFPGKPLASIGGIPVIEHVYRQCMAAEAADVWVATDDERIQACVTTFGGQAVLTGSHHTSGTDRIREAVDRLPSAPNIIINVQGDEPFVRPQQIRQLIRLFDNPEVGIATLCTPITDAGTLMDPGKVKLVRDTSGRALYFSRSAIPFLRNEAAQDWTVHHTYYQHIGMYGYTRPMLTTITDLPEGQLEKAESLEQLRWLENGLPIHTAVTSESTIGIDTPDDLERARIWWDTYHR